MADWIRMPFGLVGQVGERMCSVGVGADHIMIRGNFWVDVTIEKFVALLCENVGGNQAAVWSRARLRTLC